MAGAPGFSGNRGRGGNPGSPGPMGPKGAAVRKQFTIMRNSRTIRFVYDLHNIICILECV